MPCSCGGGALGAIKCPIHARTKAVNAQAWVLGRVQRNGFKARKIVWGRLLARHEKRPDEEIRRATIFVGIVRA